MKLIIDIDEQTYNKVGRYLVGLELEDLLLNVRKALRKGKKLETELEEIKLEIDEKSNMHLDGDFYILNFDVKKILDNRIKELNNDHT